MRLLRRALITITYNLIIYDLELNDKNNLRVLNQIKNIGLSIKFIVLTTRDKHQIESLLGNLNITSIIEKPFRINTIRAITKEALDFEKIKERNR